MQKRSNWKICITCFLRIARIVKHEQNEDGDNGFARPFTDFLRSARYGI